MSTWGIRTWGTHLQAWCSYLKLQLILNEPTNNVRHSFAALSNDCIFRHDQYLISINWQSQSQHSNCITSYVYLKHNIVSYTGLPFPCSKGKCSSCPQCTSLWCRTRGRCGRTWGVRYLLPLLLLQRVPAGGCRRWRTYQPPDYESASLQACSTASPV